MNYFYTALYYLTPFLLSLGYYFHSTQDLAYKILSKEKNKKSFYLSIRIGAPSLVLIFASVILAKNNQMISYLTLTLLAVSFAYSRSSFLKIYLKDKDSEIDKVETQYRTSAYIILAVLYILKNCLVINEVNLPYFLNTITESLLTFVIIDTVININKNSHKKVLLKLKSLDIINLEILTNRLGICILFSSILILITQIY